ncbi:MAG: histidine--tRNA ligase [Defluviitaleaceae bacterium]|nr:histidine--tRNA ligase [Defluviitaleaceae bacterium]
MTFSKPKGTNDFYGEQTKNWRKLEAAIHTLCAIFRVDEIRTPIYEYADLFIRGVGETSDIVQKEMFTFNDAGGRLYALRPEGTANAARAYIENGMQSLPSPVKLYYIQPNFRAERPQKGRYRQHTQFGVEYYGAAGPECEAEVISVAYELLRQIGVGGITVHLNSIGCKDCRATYNRVLLSFMEERKHNLCDLCATRLVKNPLRVLDCKNPSCKEVIQGAPSSLSALDEECAAHFDGVLKLLDLLRVDYVVDNGLVRGLDYYTRTVFEFVSTDLGAQAVLCGGGRYDGLMADCGGPPTPAVGFGMGLERLLLIIEEQKKKIGEDEAKLTYIGFLGDDGKKAAYGLTQQLRRAGIPVELDICGKSMKNQMKYADKIDAGYAIIIGDNEVASGNVNVKNMVTGEQEIQPISEIAVFLLG